MTTNQAQSTTPVMFVHDGSSIFYPTAPGRVYIVSITALADCDGSDEDYSDSTARGDLADITASVAKSGALFRVGKAAPMNWTPLNVIPGPEEADDFHDALESWADWCDRDSVRLDSLDEIKCAIGRAA